MSKLFNINIRYSDDAIFLANSTISLCKERGQNPKKVIFSSRKLFEQLSKNHLNRLVPLPGSGACVKNQNFTLF